MPVTTTKMALPTPVTADNNNLPADMLALANAIVASFDFGTFAGRPAASVANQGRRYYATDRDRMYFNTAAGAWIPVFGAPPGTVAAFLVTAAPTGWLPLDGTTVTGALSTYPDLWAVLPALVKSGSDFVTPDTRSRGPIGADAFGFGTAGAKGSIIGLDPGENTGLNQKPISVGQIPNHSHDMSHGHSVTHQAAGGHFHEIAIYDGTGGLAQLAQQYSSGPSTLWVPTSNAGGPRDRTYAALDHTHSDTVDSLSAATSAVGSGTQFNVVADSMAFAYCIRT